MLKIFGTLINFIDKTTYKSKDGLEMDSKAKVQLLIEIKRANGTIVKELQTLSIPDEKIHFYKDKLGKEVSVDVGIISKENYSFYGV